jgi:hypothetical protein
MWKSFGQAPTAGEQMQKKTVAEFFRHRSGATKSYCRTRSAVEAERGKSNPITGLGRPFGFQEVEAPRFQDNRHMKVVTLSALRTGHLYQQEIFLVLISVRG